jgi:hypothetical protein
MVSINIILQIKSRCRMNAGNKDGFGKGWDKGICAKSYRDTGAAINVRCAQGVDESYRFRHELANSCIGSGRNFL